MAHIIEFSVVGLIGNTEPIEIQLNRGVNIFFGLNGSGKTSLLKILHSAMSDNAQIIRNVVFQKAEVKIFSIDRGQSITRTLDRTKKKRKETSSYIEYYEHIDPDYARYLKRVNPQRLLSIERWSTRPNNEDHVSWAHRYLPTARLYLEPEKGLTSRNIRFSSDEMPDEDQIEFVFARLIESLWSNYTSQMLQQVGEAQANGLANIFRAVLSDNHQQHEAKQIESKLAFERLAAFLRRQGSINLLGSYRSFAKRYANEPQLRRVVTDINAVEERIEEATARRDTLQRLIQDMFSGSKKVIFGDMAISIESTLKTSISLESLSTGEKHLLRILVEAILAEQNSLIIDEPELSMHIDWQQRLVAAIQQVSPDAQLILATHSPEIMADVDDKNIFRI